MIFELTDEYIELYKLIKVMDLVDSGGDAKQLIEHEAVFRNGEVETRKRAKIRRGDIITIGDATIVVK